jgi:ribose transport system ATP-binding protein
MTPLIELQHISKAFPGVLALADVSLSLAAGEIHGLVGENGAGKSTLMKILAGLGTPDSGRILLDGRAVGFRNVQDSLRQGINLVYQEIKLVPESSIAENVMLDKLPVRGWGGRIDWGAVREAAGRCTDAVGLDLSVDTPVRGLSAAQKKLVQIARALAGKARLLLLDEPTASLTRHETDKLLGVLRRLRSQGVAMIYVSHRLDEVMALCDRVSVLRDGRLVGTRRAGQITRPELVKMMVGREYHEDRLGRLKVEGAGEVLRVENLERTGKVRDVSLSLRQGEILGFYGLVGAGRTETARLLIGADRADRGRMFIRGEPCRPRSVCQSLRRHRMGYVSENRKEEGLFLEESVGTNIAVTVWHRLVHRLTRRISRRRETAVALEWAERLGVRYTGLAQAVKNLSGGNQQKVCLAKWLAADCDILIIDEPTVGVDVGAKQQIHRLIWDLAAAQGKSIILISSDLPEIIRLASRILVFKDGRIVGEVADAQSGEAQKVAQTIGGLLA